MNVYIYILNVFTRVTNQITDKPLVSEPKEQEKLLVSWAAAHLSLKHTAQSNASAY